MLRYQYDVSTNNRKKMKSVCHFPTLLELNGQSYVLSSARVHRGNSANCWHYFAYVFDSQTNQYTLFDDHKEARVMEDSSESNAVKL